ncbi:methylated-DNA--[protein]-cysteine S-methyltransferase [Microscilla marina]|uniref:Methylated-DNA--protein-cysteine methyltransferase n=1 Tax=Microscilla marina ATCC 23134 TaxID=313606 RepID=A1ZWF6_MICM2|nr:methylated-DNA--[protein]-cysteine S-methyltransferase [Microscilla marina]EAY25296.1 methylated-DNA--protein-cysteine methyltransferase [Microscilla marina ATCC 23134]
MEDQLHQFMYQSPIGELEIIGNDAGIQAILFVDNTTETVLPNAPANVVPTHLPKVLQACVTQLDEYFMGKREAFDLLLNPQGTGFQRRVWEALCQIPLGQISTYKKIAKAIELPKGAQAVGGANGQNPLSIVVPCHRVIGSNGTLTGYAGGLWRKSWLLKHEKVKLPGTQLSLI